MKLLSPGTRVFCNAPMFGKFGWGTVSENQAGATVMLVPVEFDDGSKYRVPAFVLSLETIPGQDPHPRVSA